MISTEIIESFVKYALASAKLVSEKPLSLLIVGEPESGKSSNIKKYCLKCDGVLYTTDATAYGLIRETDNLALVLQKKVRFFVIPDLLNCLSRKPSTVDSLIMFLNAIIEEGVVNISTYATKIKLEDKKVASDIKVGLITSITKQVLFDKRHQWSKVGFLSRCLPISYDYNMATRIKIFNYIAEQQHMKEHLERLLIKGKTYDVELSVEMAKRLIPYSQLFGDAQRCYGFRMQKQLQVLLKAIARYRGKKIVDEEDFKEFERLVNYINLEFNKV